MFVRLDGRSSFADVVVSPEPAWIEEVGILLDGRIDNLADIRRALGTSETVGVHATLLEGFRVWRGDLLRRLVGDYAFIIIDRRQRQLVAARDPFGVRPLFYKTAGQTLWLSNRIGQLVERNEPLDDHRIVEYLIRRHDAPGRTFFSNVREVPAGAFVLATQDSLTVSTYWEPEVEAQPPFGNRTEFESRFRHLFLQAVARRLDPDRPVIIQVSGGLDSSAIACAADIVGRPSSGARFEVMGAAAVYPGLPCDESAYIDAVARHVRYPIVRWDDTVPELDDLFDPHPHEPGIRNLFRGGSAGDLRLANDSKARVLLSGVGGDNLGIVEGYVADLIRTRRWRAAFTELVCFPGATAHKRIRRIRQVLRQSVPQRFEGFLSRLRMATPPAWLTPYARHLARSVGPAGQSLPRNLSNLQRSVWRRLTAPEIFRNVSMMNVAASTHGCEYRFPYLDKDLILCAMAAPLECWPRPGPFARLHRGPLAEILPPAIATRFGKAEFTPAVARKVQVAGLQALSAFGDEWISERYIDPDAARQYCRAVIASPNTTPGHHWLEVWAILTFEAWLRGREGLVSTRPH